MKHFTLTRKRLLLTLILALPTSYYFLTHTLVGSIIQCNNHLHGFGHYCYFASTSYTYPLRGFIVFCIFLLSYSFSSMCTVVVDKKRKRTQKKTKPTKNKTKKKKK